MCKSIELKLLLFNTSTYFIFLHRSCLHSWLEQVTNCPTCRTPLVSSPNESDAEQRNILGQDDMQPRPANQTTNHFFHFDGKCTHKCINEH